MKLGRLNTIITVLSIATIFDLLGVAKPATAVNLTGLTPTNTLINFDSNNPSVTTSVNITGLENGNLLGIDYRPANGFLYGLTDTNNIYTINADSGVASFVSTLSIPFEGGFQSGIDFNPVADRLRVVGSNDQNLRINVDTGATIADSPLAFGAGDPNFGANPNISGAAYTNSFAGPPGPPRTTTLIDIDYVLNIFAIQNPPNAGTLRTGGSGNANLAPIFGFDIFTAANGDNIVYVASNNAQSQTALFSLNLNNLQAGESVVPIGSNNTIAFVGLAAEPIAAEPVPEPSSVLGMLTFGAFGAASLFKRKQKQNVKP